MIIKVISLWQPWAWAMWDGLKKYETRSAGAPVVAQLRSYKGWLGIHAAKKKFDPAEYDEEFVGAIRRIFRSSEGTEGFHEAMHYGCIGGICRFDGGIFQTQSIKSKLSAGEIFWGDYTDDRRAIHCPNVVPLEVPVPIRGHQGLFNWEVWPEVEALLQKAVA